jgi:hypothetical protein
MSTPTYVLGWAAFIVLAVAAYCCSVQLSRPDDDWKGWTEWNVPYKRPRWGVQPRPLLKLIVLVPALYLLADWLKNDTTSVVSVWFKQL